MNRLLFAALLLATAARAASAEGDAAKGQKVFLKCKACHTAEQPANRVGPGLKGVVGRKAASVETYNYSEAMKKKGDQGLVWDEAHLKPYLASPKDLCRGPRWRSED